LFLRTMRSRILATLVVLVAALAAAVPPSWAYSETDLKTRISREMSRAGPHSGAYVRDMDSGEELFALHENVVRVPASVEKLYTTATALLRFGPSATFQTSAVTAPQAPVGPDGVLHGNLVLVGGGDPFFGDESAAQLAGAVRLMGITRIDGAVVGDESGFDRLRSGCCAGYDVDLGGVLSALAYDRGIFRGRARLEAAPFAAARFAAQLRRLGIRAAAASTSGLAPPGARLIAAVPSHSVGELVRLTNVPSNNFAAEMLLKDLGARFGGAGSRSAGADVVRDTLDDLGVRPRIVDGSGLSRLNRTTPRQVVRLLERMHNQDVAQSFRSSLAIPGLTGTVKNRMRGTAASRGCQLKTGTLRGVSALAGYCTTVAGRDIGFALLMNRVNISGAHALQDRIATAIARLDEAGASAPLPEAGGTVPQPGPGRTAHLSSASSPASSSTATPSRSAFSSFEPGDAPATT
jgi:D-alanyl-D-alanine carboxypeptidase/D-alanyl-D-alanine-endopeptidase (penicillin-binding protein 4)